MPSKLDVTRLVQKFAGCSHPEAALAASVICRDPEAVDLLVTAALKCGAATAATGAGGVIAISGLSPFSLPMVSVGVGVAALSASKAKQFCTEMVELGIGSVPETTKSLLR
jgi:hypothetical protein